MLSPSVLCFLLSTVRDANQQLQWRVGYTLLLSIARVSQPHTQLQCRRHVYSVRYATHTHARSAVLVNVVLPTRHTPFSDGITVAHSTRCHCVRIADTSLHRGVRLSMILFVHDLVSLHHCRLVDTLLHCTCWTIVLIWAVVLVAMCVCVHVCMRARACVLCTCTCMRMRCLVCLLPTAVLDGVSQFVMLTMLVSMALGWTAGPRSQDLRANKKAIASLSLVAAIMVSHAHPATYCTFEHTQLALAIVLFSACLCM